MSSGLRQGPEVAKLFLLNREYDEAVESDQPRSAAIAGNNVSERLSAGSYSYEWDASILASGVYLYRLQAGDPSSSAGHSYVQTRKMILIR